MARELKEIICGDVKTRLENLTACVLVDYRGLDSEHTQDLRASLRKQGVLMRVIHNRLAQRVLAETGAPEEFRALLRGPTAILHGAGELQGAEGALVASRSIVQWRKKNADLAPIKGGLFEGRALSVADVEKLAAVPDKDALRARILGTFLAPAACLATAAQSLLSQFVGCAKARREDLEREGSQKGPDGGGA